MTAEKVFLSVNSQWICGAVALKRRLFLAQWRAQNGRESDPNVSALPLLYYVTSAPEANKRFKEKLISNCKPTMWNFRFGRSEREKGEDSVNFGTDNHVACADCRVHFGLRRDHDEWLLRRKSCFFLKKYHATSSNEKPTSTHHQWGE